MFKYQILTYRKVNLFTEPHKPWVAKCLLNFDIFEGAPLVLRAETREKALSLMTEQIKQKFSTIGEDAIISDYYLVEKAELEERKEAI